MHILLNWLAQGGVVALAAAAVLRVIPRSRTRSRYCFAWAACMVVAGLPALPHMAALAFRVTPADHAFVSLDPIVSVPTAWWSSTALAVLLWTIWSGACAIRVGFAALALRDTKRRCRQCPRDLLARLQHWTQVRTTGRRTCVMLSTDVCTAAVIGGGAPLIALAPSLLEDLTEDDIDRVVIHEWAHVQRYDDVTRFFQQVVFIVAGWHPAVWWLQRQMELEREVACDEIVVAVTGSAKAYARCLTTLAALPERVHPPSALAVVSSSGLRRRVVRILAGQRIASARPWRAVALCASLVLAAFAVVVCKLEIAERGAAESSVFTSVRPAIPTSAATLTSAFFSLPARAESEVTSKTPVRLHAEGRVTIAKREDAPLRLTMATGQAMDPPMTTAPVDAPSRLLDSHLAVPTWGVVTLATGPPAASVTGPHISALALPPPDEAARAPWAAAAAAGVGMGQASRNAGVATAGFVSRFGKKIARSF